ncbi:hypothetical protein [Micromonospora sp. NPDC049891]|uniref:hypothetical protein n=1 Tax=Micromonospora sp. NPDC049891 TaxID=3155655 RepID=UPI0033EA235F
MTGRLSLWWASRRALAAEVESLRHECARLRRGLHESETRRVEQVGRLGDQIASLRAEAKALDAAHQQQRRDLEAERVWGNRIAHRVSTAIRWSDCLPTGRAAELRALLSPAIPGTTPTSVEESPNAAV